MKKFAVDAVAMGTPAGGYPGAFGHCLVLLLESLTSGHSCIHLFSGSSTIGTPRVDNHHINSTHQQDVFEYIKTDEIVYDFALLDPPYEKTSRLASYPETPVSNNVPRRRELAAWLKLHARKIIWLDICAPIFEPFVREAVYLVLPGGYRRVRVLSVLRNEALAPASTDEEKP